MSDKVKKGYATMAGDVITFREQLEKFKAANVIHEKYISTQFLLIPNPDKKVLDAQGNPEMIQQVIVTALLIFTPIAKPA